MLFHLNRPKINDTLVVFFVFISSFILLSNEIRFISMGLVFLVTFSLFFSDLSHSLLIKKNIFFLLIFIFLSFIHVFSSSELTKYSFDKRLYFYFILFLVFFLASSSKFYDKDFNIIYFGLLGVGGIYFLLSMGFKPSEENMRVSELGLNPLILSRNIALMGVLSLFLRKKKIAYFLFCLSLFGVILTGSRGPFFILILIMFFYFFNEKKYFLIFTSFIFLFFLFFSYEFILNLLPEVFSGRFTEEAIENQLNSNSELSRGSLFGLAFQLWLENPFFGVGLGNYSYYAPVNAPHNIYLEVLSEMGLLYFSLFLVFIITSLRAGYRQIKSNSNYKLKGLYFLYIFFVLSMFADGELTIQSFLLYYLGFLFLGLDFKSRSLDISKKTHER